MESKLNQSAKLSQSMDPSMLKSLPTVCNNLPTSQARRNYLNCHQLKQSKMGFQNASIYETLKKNR